MDRTSGRRCCGSTPEIDPAVRRQSGEDHVGSDVLVQRGSDALDLVRIGIGQRRGGNPGYALGVAHLAGVGEAVAVGTDGADQQPGTDNSNKRDNTLVYDAA